MNEKTTIEIVSIATIVTIAAILAFTFTLPSANAVNDEDLEGHWFAIGGNCITYDNECIDYKFNDPNIRAYDLDIYSVDQKLFYGMIQGERITGDVLNKVAKFNNYSDSGYSYYAEFTLISENRAFLVVIGVCEEDTYETNTTCSFMLFSKDMVEYKYELVTNEKSEFNTCYSAKTYTSDSTADIEKPNLNISIQHGALVNIDLEFSKTTVSMKGYATRDSNNACVGLFLDNSGNQYALNAHNNTLTLTTISGDSCTKYTFTSDDKEPETQNILNISNKHYTLYDNNTMDLNGNIEDERSESYIIIDRQENDIVFSTIQINGMITNCVGYLVKIWNVTYYVYESDYKKIGYIFDDAKQMRIIYSDTDTKSSSSSYFKEVNYDSITDFTGHWYASMVMGFDKYGESFVRTSTNYDHMELMDVDIYTEKNGLVFCRSDSMNITGCIVNEMITLRVLKDGYKWTGMGYFLDKDTLIIDGLRYYEDGVTATYKSILTREFTTTSVGQSLEKYLGDWKSEWSYTYNGEYSAVNGTNLKITEVNGDTFKGYADLVDCDTNKVKNMEIKGAIMSNNVNFRYGLMVNEIG